MRRARVMLGETIFSLGLQYYWSRHINYACLQLTRACCVLTFFIFKALPLSYFLTTSVCSLFPRVKERMEHSSGSVEPLKTCSYVVSSRVL